MIGVVVSCLVGMGFETLPIASVRPFGQISIIDSVRKILTFMIIDHISKYEILLLNRKSILLLCAMPMDGTGKALIK